MLKVCEPYSSGVQRVVTCVVFRLQQFTTECRKYSGLHWFCFSPLCDWSKRTCATLSTNHVQNQSQSRLSHPRFPSLWTVYCLLRVLIGSCSYFPIFWLGLVITLVLCLRHSIGNALRASNHQLLQNYIV